MLIKITFAGLVLAVYKQVFKEELSDHKFVSAINSNNDEQIYIATDLGVVKYDINTEDLKIYYIDPDAPIDPKRSPIVYLMEDDQERLWIASEDGLMQLDLKTNTYSFFQNDPFDSTSLVDNSVTQISFTSTGDLWCSTYNGLSKIVETESGIKFKNYKASNKEYGLKSNKITSIVDLDSMLVLGTRSGIHALDYSSERFYDFREDNEKINVLSLSKVPNGILWGSTLNSIFQFDLKTKKVYVFDYKDGAANAHYLHQSTFLSHDTLLHFGHMSGFTLIDPIGFETNDTPPNVSITEVEVFDDHGRFQYNMIHKDHIQVCSDYYSIEINFAALNYNRPEKTRYKYMLDGFDQDWKFLDKNLSVTYTNLDPGEYTFNVQASNEVGIWNNKGASIEIIVEPLFRETAIAKLLFFILSVLLIHLGVKSYTNRIKNRNKQLKSYNENLNREIKQRENIELALKNINEELLRSNKELEQFAYIASHDLQEPLRITGSFIDLLGERYGNVLDEDAYKFINFAKGGVGRMSILIKNLLTFSKVGGTVLEFNETPLKKIVEEKLLDLGALINEKNVEIQLNNLPTIICEKNQIGMLFYNLINNAIKFNNKPNPLVIISHQESTEQEHIFSVQDNGIGIAKIHREKIFEIFKRLHDKDKYEGTGIGLALCKKIVTRHGGKIWIDSIVGEGTTFSFSLAKDPQKYQDNKANLAPSQLAIVN